MNAEKKILITFLCSSGMSKEGAELFVNYYCNNPEEYTQTNIGFILDLIKYVLNSQ